MASNPPIAGLSANGSFSLQARIDRFLTTIEPHLQYFTNQGRAHLDSTIKRDRAERRYLNHDKTGWASVPLGGTSLVDASGGAGDISRGSEDSVNAMSSVSQRGGRVARMRDRNGNTKANARIGDLPKKTGKAWTKTGALETPIEIDSSSSPIQPWKEIKATIPVAISPASLPIPSPVLVPGLDYLAGIMIAPRPTNPAYHAKQMFVRARRKPIVIPADDKSSRKRKHVVDEGDSGGKRHNIIDKAKRHIQRDESPEIQILPDAGNEQRSNAPPAIPDPKRRKQRQESAALGAGTSNPRILPRKQTGIKIAERKLIVLPDWYGKESYCEPGPLQEASSKLNMTIPIPKKKETDVKASIIVGETSKKKKSSNNAAITLTAEEKAREEILTARRTRRRERMRLKTASVPISKRSGNKVTKEEDDGQSCSDHDGADQITRAGSRGVQAKKAKTSLKQKAINQRGNIGTALLQAYDNSGNMDRSHRITLPKTTLRLGIFSKGMSSRQGETSKGVKHPPDLQFQTESFMKRKEKHPAISSSDPTNMNGSDASSESDCQVEERVVTPVKKTKTQQPDMKKGRKHKASSEMPQSEGKSKQTSKEWKQPSPDWPSVLPTSDRSDGLKNADNRDNSASLARSKGITKCFPPSESGQKSSCLSSNHDNMVSPHSRSASAPVMMNLPSTTRRPQHSGRSPALRFVDSLERQSLNAQQPMGESRLSSESPPLGDISYGSILANALAEASGPSVIVQVSSSAFGSLLNAYIKYGSDQDSAADYQRESDANWARAQEWQAIDVEGYDSEDEQNQIIPDEFNQEVHNDAAEATRQILSYDVPLPSDPVEAESQDDLSEGEIAGVEFVDLIRRDDDKLGGDGVLEELEPLDHLRHIGPLVPSSDYSNHINALDVFGTDAEQARRVLYGTSFHR
ncbi:hypothetical protein QFC21_003616 [Naganishia friedmannii]|uniref:Uncharacterized protein n=1 Tax=Naganishia friedmannii TaxID=89922 RepID=A0ACC2VNT4_9TREE|nr:hypothetical protein QFC21_003616 [Naganishia friedmannii]